MFWESYKFLAVVSLTYLHICFMYEGVYQSADSPSVNFFKQITKQVKDIKMSVEENIFPYCKVKITVLLWNNQSEAYKVIL